MQTAVTMQAHVQEQMPEIQTDTVQIKQAVMSAGML